MQNFLYISIGAVLGANTRYWIVDLLEKKMITTLPLGTILVNISGSFLLGLFITLATEKMNIDPKMNLLFTTGFFGAYTTFSTYALQSINLFSDGKWSLGLFNLIGSSIIGGLAAVLGIYLGRSL